jgi:serine/threonine protein kinase
VFLAFDLHHGDEAVIIKALNTSLQGTPDAELDRTLVENFQNEAIAIDRVRHPNIIRRLGHGTACDLDEVPFHYLVLEYMPGGDLLKLCSRQPMTLDQALFFFQQVAEALAYAHSSQVIHRDIKPNNLLLSADGKTVKIADFGIAKMAHDDSGDITRVGTNVYAPPEHHPEAHEDEQAEKLTPSADIYSLAKTIYTAMTGRAPRQFARQPVSELPVELRSQPWGAGLTAILARATASRVAERYAAVEEFWSDFARLRLGETEEGRLDGDDEATIVRRRLKATSSAGPGAVKPNFQALAATTSSAIAQQGRIVVELPRRLAAEPGVPGKPLHALDQTNSKQPERAQTSRVGRPPETKVFGTEQVVKHHATKAASGTLTRLRFAFKAAWLRWAFALFLVAAVIGIAVSVYYHFAEPGSTPAWFGFQTKEGVISSALNVNLRSEPSGTVLAVLPAGTRVRIVEERGAWMRVRILHWVGAAPEGAPDNGWVGSQFVRLD